jgi:hypothetical protein
MNNLKLLSCFVGLTLTLAFATSVTAQKGCEPGQISTPPCTAAQPTTDESTDTGKFLTPSADSVDVVSVADAALTAMLIF